MHGLYEIRQKLGIRQVDGQNDSLINCVLDPPQVKLRLGVNKQRVTYHICIKHPIEDWTVALDVNMALNETGANRIPEKIQNRIKNLGDHSVYQLQVNFTGEFRVSLLYISRYVAESGYRCLDGQVPMLRNTPESNILSCIKNANKSLDAPTLVPTELNFQYIPFVTDKMDTQGKEGIKEGAANMLVYLQMTAHRPLPHDFLPISTNWIIPPADNKSEAYDGPICFSKNIFLDEWLMPKMARFNNQSTWVTTAAEWTQSWFAFGFKLEGQVGISQADKDGDAQFKNTE
ncbi:hypothetical protein FRB95_012211 [Tulasnella sp. JGI-2019a]|nr:hypothetical protein FRB95_012211 [Tulasnella sp. JGI-2019a]